MSFREKSAWITLVTLIAMTVVFLLHLPWPPALTPTPSPSLFHVLLITIVAFVAVEILAHIVIAVFAPRDAHTPKDERERLIELKSRSTAAYVYAALSLGSIGVGLHVVGANAIGIAYLVLMSFVAAQIVNYGLRVYYYRRGI